MKKEKERKKEWNLITIGFEVLNGDLGFGRSGHFVDPAQVDEGKTSGGK